MMPLERHVNEALDRGEPILDLVRWIEVCQILHYCSHSASSDNKTFNVENGGSVVIGLSKNSVKE